MLVEAGSTNKDSITFTLKGYEPLAVRATLKEDGTIVKERINRIEESIKLRKETNRLCKGLKLNKVKTILCFAIILISLLITVVLKNHMIIMALVFLVLDKLLEQSNFLEFLVNMYAFEKTLKNSRGLHAAEHMSMLAYNDLKRVPTVDEVRRYSRFTEACSAVAPYKASIMLATMYILYGFVPIYLDFPIKVTLNVLFFVLVLILERKKFFKYFGFFSLKKPTDKEIEVAIAALEEYEKANKEFKENPENFISEMFNLQKKFVFFTVIMEECD